MPALGTIWLRASVLKNVAMLVTTAIKDVVVVVLKDVVATVVDVDVDVA